MPTAQLRYVPERYRAQVLPRTRKQKKEAQEPPLPDIKPKQVEVAFDFESYDKKNPYRWSPPPSYFDRWFGRPSSTEPSHDGPSQQSDLVTPRPKSSELYPDAKDDTHEKWWLLPFNERLRREAMDPNKVRQWSNTAVHLQPALDRGSVKERLTTAVECLTPHVQSFDAIAVSGISGLAFGAVLADRLDKCLVIVRKGEASASGKEVEGPDAVLRYIFVDDCICSGTTAKRVLDGVAGRYAAAKCVGFYLYQERHVCLSDETERRLGQHFNPVNYYE